MKSIWSTSTAKPQTLESLVGHKAGWVRECSYIIPRLSEKVNHKEVTIMIFTVYADKAEEVSKRLDKLAKKAARYL